MDEIPYFRHDWLIILFQTQQQALFGESFSQIFRPTILAVRHYGITGMNSIILCGSLLRQYGCIVPIMLLLLLGNSKAQEQHWTALHFTAAPNSVQRIATGVEVLCDSAGKRTLDDVLHEGNNNFRSLAQLKTNRLNFGFTSAAYWMRFRLHDSAAREWFLTFIPVSYTDLVECYIPTPDGKWQRSISGKTVPITVRDIAWRSVAFRLPARQDITVYVRFSGTWIFSNEPAIMMSSHLVSFYIPLERFIFGVLVGIVLAMSLYNFFLYLRLRDRVYGFYLLYILFFSVHTLVFNSLLYYEIFPDVAPEISALSLMVLPNLAGTYLAFFASEFLLLAITQPRVWRVNHVLALASAAIGSAAFFVGLISMPAGQLLFPLSGIVGLASTGIVFGAALRSVWRKESTGRYFFAAMVVFLLGIIATVLGNLNLITLSFGAYYGSLTGFALQLLLFSFALADRIRALRLKLAVEHENTRLAEQEHRLEQQKNEALQAANTEIIAQKLLVEDQKLAIETTNTELQAINDELVRQQSLLEEQAVETELLNTELQERNNELRLLSEERSELLGIVSHDLKNPIASIQGLAEVLNADENILSDEHRRHLFSMIQQTAERMNGLVKNLLDVNAIENGSMVPIIATVNVVHVFQQLVSFYAPRAAKKDITINLREGELIYAYADEQMIAQVADNLLSNAVKYSPLGKTVVVSVFAHHASSIDTQDIQQGMEHLTKYQEESGGQPVCVMTVKDEGNGITKEDMPKLFGKFSRLSTRPTADEDSTGLGLSIVKKLVVQMKGTIWCESEPGKGATFVVVLPLAQAPIDTKN